MQRLANGCFRVHDYGMSLEIVSDLMGGYVEGRNIFFQWRISGFDCLENMVDIIY